MVNNNVIVFMPVNKAARLRHEILDACFRNRKKWTKKSLLEFLNKKLNEHYGGGVAISLSQIRNDINDMQSMYGAPIESVQEGIQTYYYYDDPKFSIITLPIEEKDMALLHLTVHLLQQIKGFYLADEVAEVLQKLENKVQHSMELDKPVIAFENSPSALGVENLGDIYQAIVRKCVLKIKYKHFRASEAQEQVIHPYYLKEYNSRWFLFGWSDQNRRVENMALDRMESIKATAGEYVLNTVFDPETHFANIVGVTYSKDLPVEKIELLFSKDRAPYVSTKQIHATQIVLKEYADGKLLVAVSLAINKELKALILGFGNDVEVKSPQSLRDEIRESLNKAVSSY